MKSLSCSLQEVLEELEDHCGKIDFAQGTIPVVRFSYFVFRFWKRVESVDNCWISP